MGSIDHKYSNNKIKGCQAITHIGILSPNKEFPGAPKDTVSWAAYRFDAKPHLIYRYSKFCPATEPQPPTTPKACRWGRRNPVMIGGSDFGRDARPPHLCSTCVAAQGEQEPEYHCARGLFSIRWTGAGWVKSLPKSASSPVRQSVERPTKRRVPVLRRDPTQPAWPRPACLMAGENGLK